MSWNSWAEGQAAGCSRLRVKDGNKVRRGPTSKGYWWTSSRAQLSAS